MWRETTSLRIFKDTHDRWPEILEQEFQGEANQQQQTEKLLSWIEKQLKKVDNDDLTIMKERANQGVSE